MLARWCTGKQVGDMVFNIFVELDLPCPQKECSDVSPAIRKRLDALLILAASGDRAGFAEAFKKSRINTKDAFMFLLADIIGSLRRLPEDEQFLYPETSCGWLGLLRTLQLAQLPHYPEALYRLQTLSESGRLHPEDQLLMESSQAIVLLQNMQIKKPALHLQLPLLIGTLCR